MYLFNWVYRCKCQSCIVIVCMCVYYLVTYSPIKNIKDKTLFISFTLMTQAASVHKQTEIENNIRGISVSHIISAYILALNFNQSLSILPF